MDDRMSFVAEPGWYHEAHEAFVPDRNGGGGGFFYLRLLKKLPCSILGRLTPSTYCGSTPWGSPSLRPCPWSGASRRAGA